MDSTCFEDTYVSIYICIGIVIGMIVIRIYDILYIYMYSCSKCFNHVRDIWDDNRHLTSLHGS